jgi:murein DD-endopeptidase MepM/ murein hydrolase activator NlpD
MSLTVFPDDRHHRGRFGTTTGHRLVTAALLFCIAVGAGVALGRIWTDPTTYPLNPLPNAASESAELVAIRQQAEHQIAALTAKVASLQAQVNRLNMVGERLIDAADLPADQFNLRQPPPMGGPAQTSSEQGLLEVSDMLQRMTQLEQDLLQEQSRFSLLESLDLNHHIGLNSQLSGRPVLAGYLSSPFGVRTDPFTGESAIHEGVDFAGEEGSAVIATAGGIVVWAGERLGYGRMVEVEHAGGYRTRYAHAKAVTVQIGQLVDKGQQVATLGNTGRSTGPHVHYEVLKNGQQINPQAFIGPLNHRLYGSARTALRSQH